VSSAWRTCGTRPSAPCSRLAGPIRSVGGPRTRSHMAPMPAPAPSAIGFGSGQAIARYFGAFDQGHGLPEVVWQCHLIVPPAHGSVQLRVLFWECLYQHLASATPFSQRCSLVVQMSVDT
jgi:hypothetical protein